jgi:hypothetical protein
MNLLSLIGDIGLPEPLPASIDSAARAALEHEIKATGRSRGLLRRLARRGVLLPSALLLTTVAAAAATAVATGFFNLNQQAKQNVADTPLQLFQADLPARFGASPASLWRQTAIPSSVHTIATPTIPGVGTVQYWVANTTQHGICTAIRLPDGSWAGLKNFQEVGNSLVGCRPTRAQLSAGALILSGFDYTYSYLLTRSRKELLLDYGEIIAPGDPTEVRDETTGATALVIDKKYFLLVSHGGPYSAVNTHLVALNSAGKIVADEREPLPDRAHPSGSTTG